MGTSGLFTPTTTGELVVYFNDDIWPDNTGSWDVCVEPALQLNIDVADNPIPPDRAIPHVKGQTLVTVSSVPPVAGMEITMSTAASTNSGGHLEIQGHASGRPIGTFQPSNGVTDGTGQFTTTYKSTQIGGVETFYATASDSGYGVAVRPVVIGIPDMVALEPGFGYVLTGQKLWHLQNHWAEVGIRTLVRFIAEEYRAEYPLAPWLEYNDISLEHGGKFDLSQNWEGSGGHKEHRLGFDMDVNP